MHMGVKVVCLTFILSLCQQQISKMRTLCLERKEPRLDDDLSPYNLLLFCFSLVFKKMREKADTKVSAAIWPHPFILLLHLESCTLKAGSVLEELNYYALITRNNDRLVNFS